MITGCLMLCCVLLICWIGWMTTPTFGMEYPPEAYLQATPFSLETFLQHPLSTLWQWLGEKLHQHVMDVLGPTKQLAGLLLCAAALKFLIADSRWDTLLEWLFACLCFLLAEDMCIRLSQAASEKSIVWKDFLYSFLPVFSASMIASGQIGAAAICNGFFLTAISWVADLLHHLILPVTQLFLAITAASIFSENATAQKLSVQIGGLLRRCIGWIGGIFTALMGIQRVFSAAADNAALHTGATLLYSSIPIVGQAVSSAASGVRAGVKVMQSGLAFSALTVVGAECIPIYIQAMLCWGIFSLIGLGASLLGLNRCADLMQGMASGVYALAAVLALFFGMMSVGILMMLILGGGML